MVNETQTQLYSGIINSETMLKISHIFIKFEDMQNEEQMF